MVQFQTSLTLTLEALGASGVVLPLEQSAVIHHTLPLRHAKAGLRSLKLWGRIKTRNGKDYLIAQGTGQYHPGLLHRKTLKYCFSQDGVKWIDLEPLSEEVASKAATVTGMLSGEPAKAYPIQEPGAAPVAEGEEPAEGDAAAPGSQVSELQRLRCIVDEITEDTGVIPKDSAKQDASGKVVVTGAFSGVTYPDKLESFLHGWDGPDGPSLAKDVQGTWAMHRDQFSGQTTLRSLVWPGYQFYYNSISFTWGGQYHGDGCKNNDLVFML